MWDQRTRPSKFPPIFAIKVYFSWSILPFLKMKISPYSGENGGFLRPTNHFRYLTDHWVKCHFSDVSDGWEQYPIPIHCTSEEQLDKLFDSFKYIYKNEIQNGLPDLKDLIEPSNSNKVRIYPTNSDTNRILFQILPEYKCGCDRNGGCGSKCPCVLASIAVGGAFIYVSFSFFF